jgi:hypothetical protein
MIRSFLCLALISTTTVSVLALTALAQGIPAHSCRSGFVWREAFPGDHVCVTPESRAQAVADNAAATDRRQPDGAYGPLSCRSGYVWREARPNDMVCVTPAVRSATSEENRLAAERVLSAAAIPPAAKVRAAPPVTHATDLPAHGTPTPMGPRENPRCRDYANRAVADFKDMQRAPKCAVPSDGRWHPDRRKHYDWCLSATSAAISNETHERDAHLLNCGARYTF